MTFYLVSDTFSVYLLSILSTYLLKSKKKDRVEKEGAGDKQLKLLALKSSFYTDQLGKHIFIAKYIVLYILVYEFNCSLPPDFGHLWIIIQLLSLRSLVSELITFLFFFFLHKISNLGERQEEAYDSLAGCKEDFLFFSPQVCTSVLHCIRKQKYSVFIRQISC